MPTLEELAAQVQSGQLSLNDIRSSVGRPTVGVDESNWTSDPGLLAQRIAAIYANAGQTFTYGTATPAPTGPQAGATPGTYQTGETEQQRIDRLVADVIAERRSLDSIRQSLDLAAGRAPAPGSVTIIGNDAAIVGQGAAAVEARIRAMFANRPGLSIATAIPTSDGIPDNQNLESARATLERIFAEYGLGGPELSAWAWQRLTSGAPIDQILLELEQRPEFVAAFPEIGMIRQRNTQGGGPSVSPMRPADIIAYRATARRILGNAGLPVGFWDDNGDFTNLIVNGVSTLELADRVEQGYRQVATVDPNVRQAFADYFGPNGDAALAAWFLDPTRATSVLTEQRQAAVAGGLGRGFGFQISRERALLLADRDIEGPAASRGFAELARIRPLFDELLGEDADYTAEGEGLETIFDLGGEGAERLRHRLESRQALFRGGGGALLTEEGLGLGSVDAA